MRTPTTPQNRTATNDVDDADIYPPLPLAVQKGEELDIRLVTSVMILRNAWSFHEDCNINGHAMTRRNIAMKITWLYSTVIICPHTWSPDSYYVSLASFHFVQFIRLYSLIKLSLNLPLAPQQSPDKAKGVCSAHPYARKISFYVQNSSTHSRTW